MDECVTVIHESSRSSRYAAKWLSDFSSRPRALYGAALLRIGYGVAATGYYFTNYSDRHYLWGPDAAYPFDQFRDLLRRPAFSLYELASSQLRFEVIYHLGILVGVLFMIGVGGRLMTVVQYIFTMSIYLRNPILLDGGDNLAFLVLLYLVPVKTTGVLAVRSSRQEVPFPNHSTLMHNVGLTFIVTQLCIVYLASGMYKVQGQFWLDGTALYYILRIPEYTWPIVTDHFLSSTWLIVICTYATVFFQLMFPVLIMRPATRILAVLFGMIFHLGIALFMGLTSFSLYMIATEAILLSDRHYRWLGSRMRPIFQKSARHQQAVPTYDSGVAALQSSSGRIALSRG